MNDELNGPLVGGALVQVSRHGDGEDRLEMWWPLDGRLQLGHREVTDADHADVAVTPRLRGGPLDEVVRTSR